MDSFTDCPFIIIRTYRQSIETDFVFIFVCFPWSPLSKNFIVLYLISFECPLHCYYIRLILFVKHLTSLHEFNSVVFNLFPQYYYLGSLVSYPLYYGQ